MMPDHGGQDPLLPSNAFPSYRRRIHRTKTAPLSDFQPKDVTDNNTHLPHSPPSMFRNLHPSFRDVTILLAAYLGLGTICFYIVGNQISGKKTNAILDSLYFCVVTMTTLGYRDLVPNTVLSKLLACAFVFLGMALGGLVLSKASDYLVEKQESLLVKAFHMDKSDKEDKRNRLRYKVSLKEAC